MLDVAAGGSPAVARNRRAACCYESGATIIGRVIAKSIFVFQNSLPFATAAARIYREIKAQCAVRCGITRALLGICGAFLGIIGTIFGADKVQ